MFSEVNEGYPTFFYILEPFFVVTVVGGMKIHDIFTNQYKFIDSFLTKHLNVWVNAAQSWMDMRAWDRAADTKMKPEDFIGWECVLGQDLAAKIDVASSALLFRRAGEYRLFTKHYLPESTIEDSANSQMRGWAIRLS